MPPAQRPAERERVNHRSNWAFSAQQVRPGLAFGQQGCAAGSAGWNIGMAGTPRPGPLPAQPCDAAFAQQRLTADYCPSAPRPRAWPRQCAAARKGFIIAISSGLRVAVLRRAPRQTLVMYTGRRLAAPHPDRRQHRSSNCPARPDKGTGRRGPRRGPGLANDHHPRAPGAIAEHHVARPAFQFAMLEAAIGGAQGVQIVRPRGKARWPRHRDQPPGQRQARGVRL